MGVASRRPKIISVRNQKKDRLESSITYDVDRVSFTSEDRTIQKSFKTLKGALNYLNKLGFDTWDMKLTKHADYQSIESGILQTYEGSGFFLFVTKNL